MQARRPKSDASSSLARIDHCEVSDSGLTSSHMRRRSDVVLGDVFPDHANALPQQHTPMRVHRHRNVVSGIPDHDARRGP